MAERILANPGQSSFSALSVRLQLLAKCRSVCDVSPSCFQPHPKVQSQVIVIEPILPEFRLEPVLELCVEALLRMAFSSRRKMLRNSLTGLASLRELEDFAKVSGISLDRRPQELSSLEWLEMARNLKNANKIAKLL